MPHPNLTVGFFLCAVLCSKKFYFHCDIRAGLYFSFLIWCSMLWLCAITKCWTLASGICTQLPIVLNTTWEARLCCMWMCHEKGLKDNFNADGLFFISLLFFLSFALLLNTVFDMILLLGDHPSLQLPSCILSTLLVVWEGNLNFLMSSVKTPHLLCSHNVCSRGQILVSETSVQG